MNEMARAAETLAPKTGLNIQLEVIPFPVDQSGGLQVLHDDTQWVDIPPVEGALVINIAELLQLISIDKFKAAEIECWPIMAPVEEYQWHASSQHILSHLTNFLDL
ncbi:hypothetical protein Patl1_23196 [Pistacia atlantica]|uniref:Uncharacterized protein n=1 Tax=Pistacia atlantica TaxID=434234 RepID=A0ACC1A0A4_9ROSI|nr:hypothetical protein Patl1_23196 [Pistacia atlantica]